jgi:hypothetical protein
LEKWILPAVYFSLNAEVLKIVTLPAVYFYLTAKVLKIIILPAHIILACPPCVTKAENVSLGISIIIAQQKIEGRQQQNGISIPTVPVPFLVFYRLFLAPPLPNRTSYRIHCIESNRIESIGLVKNTPYAPPSSGGGEFWALPTCWSNTTTLR